MPRSHRQHPTPLATSVTVAALAAATGCSASGSGSASVSPTPPRQAATTPPAAPSTPLPPVPPAPSEVTAPFTTPAGPVEATTAVASRTQPSPEAPVVTQLTAGAPLEVVCQAHGVAVAGSTTWNRLADRSWVPAGSTSLPGMSLAYCTGPSSAPAPQPNPYPPSTLPQGTEEISPRARFVADQVEQTFPGIRCEWYATTREWSHHSLGSAVDCYPLTGGEPNRGWQSIAQEQTKIDVAAWAVQHHETLKVANVINSQAWWMHATPGWQPYDRLFGVTGGHFNHVHISVVDPRHDEDKGMS